MLSAFIDLLLDYLLSDDLLQFLNPFIRMQFEKLIDIDQPYRKSVHAKD